MARNILLWRWFIIYYCYFVWHFSSFLTSLYFDRFLPAIQGRWIWAKHCGSDNVSSRTSCKFMLKNITDRHQFLDFDDSCDYIWKYIMLPLWQWIKQIYVIWSFLPPLFLQVVCEFDWEFDEVDVWTYPLWFCLA